MKVGDKLSAALTADEVEMAIITAAAKKLSASISGSASYRSKMTRFNDGAVHVEFELKGPPIEGHPSINIAA